MDLDLWLRTLSPEEYAAYREATCAKRKNTSMTGAPNPKIRRMGLQSPSSGNLKGRLREDLGLQSEESETSDTIGEHSPASGRSEENEEDAEEDATNSSDQCREDEDCKFESTGDEDEDCDVESTVCNSSS